MKLYFKWLIFKSHFLFKQKLKLLYKLKNENMYNYYLIFDGNYLAYRTLFTIKNYVSNEKTLSDEKSKGIFMRKLTDDFLSIVSLFNTNKIIFVKDSKSWRKQFEGEYKATREKSEDIDWDSLFVLIDEFTDKLKNLNVVISKVDMLEGDDLIALWSKKLNKENKSAIIISADSDLIQLVELNNDSFTIIYNVKSNTKKFYASIGFKEKLFSYKFNNNSDIFESSINVLNTNKIKKLISIIESHDIEEVKSEEVLLHKVLCGDTSDNVSSVFVIEVNGKRKRITNKDAKKVISYLNDTYSKVNIDELKYNKNLQNEIRLILEKSSKLKIPKDEFFENLYRNFKLIHLNEIEYDQSLIDSFNEHINTINYNLNCKTLTKESILSETDYFKNDKMKIYSDAF
jgi:5'-3' exonuclease